MTGRRLDIIATELDAIRQGQELIEGGDWEQGEIERVLRCKVGPIIYVIDYGATEPEHGTTQRALAMRLLIKSLAWMSEQ